MKTIQINKYNCKIGQNSKENWVILDNSKPNFLIFHLSSFPSCYVILESDDTFEDIDIIKKCALLCKNNTKYRKLSNIVVDYTKCSNVIKGEIIGELVYKSLRKIQKIKI